MFFPGVFLADSTIAEARVWISVATDKMTVRALYFFVLGFSGLFAMQGCGGDEAAAETTAAAEGTTASP